MTHRVRRVLLVVLWLVAAFLTVGRGLFDFRSDEEKIRDLAADFIEACRERDSADIWELCSRGSRKKAAELAREMLGSAEPPLLPDVVDEVRFRRIVAAPAPSKPTLLAAPWQWPTAWLDDLRLTKVEIGPTEAILMADLKRHGEAQATLEFVKNRYGLFEPFDVRLILVRDGKRWRIDHVSVRTFELVEGAWPPTGIRQDVTADGGPLLVVPVGFGPSAPRPRDLASALAATTPETAVRLDVREDLAVGDLVPWLHTVVDAGWTGFTLRSCREAPPRQSYLLWMMTEYVGSVSNLSGEDRGELRIETAAAAPGKLLALEVGSGPPPARSGKEVPGEMTFRTIYPEEESLRLELELARVSGRTPILDPAADTSVFKLAAVWAGISDRQSGPVRLALPGPGDAESRRLERAK